MKRLAILILAAAFVLPACANSPNDRSIDDTADLQVAVQTFHREMRWQRWEAAVALVAPEERAAFMARYDELGEDYKISEMEVKSVVRGEDSAIVDVEQQSFKEPAMIVKKERYIEMWEKRDKDWLLIKRELKKEYEERIEEEKREKSEEKEDTTADPPPQDDP
jgi:hypothetical protein